MKNNTSCPSASRKCSATVRPVSPTRARAPGGSFTCPYTSAHLLSNCHQQISYLIINGFLGCATQMSFGRINWGHDPRERKLSNYSGTNKVKQVCTCFSQSLMTLLSIISLYKSLPSRVRSPTPANTEKPPADIQTDQQIACHCSLNSPDTRISVIDAFLHSEYQLDSQLSIYS